jgi:hypothetical protein
LGAIRAVTITVPALDPVEQAYTTWLGHRVMARGTVSAGCAALWGAPAAQGCRVLVLAPEVGEETYLRFIEDPQAGTAAPFKTFGWNATELTVRDTDGLAAKLAGSPYSVIGAPANLTGFEWIRAMQVLGPAGECLYLTDVGRDGDLAHARAGVGQVFIMVCAGPDILAMADFYRERFGAEVSDLVTVPIGVINRAHALPAGTRHGLALVTLPGGTRVELDQYPVTATQRVVRPGHLPPGVSVVTCGAAGAFAERSDMPPFGGHGVRCVIGAAGEFIELVEEAVPDRNVVKP